MNTFSLLPLIAFFINISLGIFILYRESGSKMNRLYALFTFSLAMWSLGDFFVFSSPTAAAALQWNNVTLAGSSLLAAFILHFFFVFTKNRLASRSMFYVALYAPSLFFIIVNSTTELVFGTMHMAWWGYTASYGPLYTLFAIYVAGYVINGLVLCYRFYLRSGSERARKQARLLIIGIFIPLIGGIITQIIFPIYLSEAIPPLTTTLTTVMATIIAYSINKYRLLAHTYFSIRRKLTVIFLLLILVTGMFVWFSGTMLLRGNIDTQVAQRLESIAHLRASHIQILLKDYREDVMIISPQFKAVLEANPADPGYGLISQEAGESMGDIVRSYSHFLRVSLIDTDGIVVASSDGGSVGKEMGNVVSSVRDGDVYIGDIYLSEGFGEASMDMGTAVTDGNGDVLGVVDIQINMSGIYGITTGSFRSEELAEVYLINSGGYMITPSRFPGVAGIRVNTSNARECLDKKSDGDVSDFPNYMGTNVMGTYAYIPESGWCLLAEMDEDEAFASMYQIQNIVLLVIIILLALGTVFSYLFSKSLTGPIIRLRDISREIGKGNLNAKVNIRTNDEIGDLASSFRQMVRGVKKSQNEVKERARILDEKVKELESSKTAILNIMEDVEDTNVKLSKAQKDLKASYAKLKELDVKKDEFISIAAHELKTPLTSIHGFSQLLQNEKTMKDRESSRKYLGIIDKETKRLSNLVTEILELSRIDLGTIKFELESVSVREIMDSIMKEMGIRASEKGLKIECRIGRGVASIETDRERFIQVVLNLVNNALKYTPEGSVMVDVKLEGGDLHFCVKDTGIGIAKENLEKIFQRFFQVDSSYTRKGSGTGLGLSLAREYIQKLGGRIWVTSEVGKGSEFHFTMPVRSSIKAEDRKEGSKEAVKDNKE